MRSVFRSMGYWSLQRFVSFTTRDQHLESPLALFGNFQPLLGRHFRQSLLCGLDPSSLTGFGPNLCLATLASCSSASSRGSLRSSIDPVDSRIRTPPGRLWMVSPRLVRTPRDVHPERFVPPFDRQAALHSLQATDRSAVSASGPSGEELLPGARVAVEAYRPPAPDGRLEPALGRLPLERKRLVQGPFVPWGNGHRGNRVMPQLEQLAVCGSSRVDSGRHRLAELSTMSPRRVECLLVLAPKPVVVCRPKRPLLVRPHLLASDLGSVYTGTKSPYRSQSRCLDHPRPSADALHAKFGLVASTIASPLPRRTKRTPKRPSSS